MDIHNTQNIVSHTYVMAGLRSDAEDLGHREHVDRAQEQPLMIFDNARALMHRNLTPEEAVGSYCLLGSSVWGPQPRPCSRGAAAPRSFSTSHAKLLEAIILNVSWFLS